MAADGLLPAALGRTDARGTPRNAVLFAAVCYSLFMLLPFSGLVVADVLLYSLALMLELGALELARELMEVIRDDELRESMSSAAAQRARDFEIDQVADRYLEDFGLICEGDDLETTSAYLGASGT